MKKRGRPPNDPQADEAIARTAETLISWGFSHQQAYKVIRTLAPRILRRPAIDWKRVEQIHGRWRKRQGVEAWLAGTGVLLLRVAEAVKIGQKGDKSRPRRKKKGFTKMGKRILTKASQQVRVPVDVPRLGANVFPKRLGIKEVARRLLENGGKWPRETIPVSLACPNAIKSFDDDETVDLDDLVLSEPLELTPRAAAAQVRWLSQMPRIEPISLTEGQLRRRAAMWRQLLRQRKMP